MYRKKKGQSTLEYIILVTGIVAAFIFFAGPTGIFKDKVTNSVNQVSDEMLEMANRISNSRPLAP